MFRKITKSKFTSWNWRASSMTSLLCSSNRSTIIRQRIAELGINQHKSQTDFVTPSHHAGSHVWIAEKIATLINGPMKKAPRARYYPDARYKAKIINVIDVYDGEQVSKVTLTDFSHKLHKYVTQTDPYYTQCGELPSLLECFAVADCVRYENEYCIDFRGDLGDNMVQFWLELIVHGSEESLHSNTTTIDKNDFVNNFLFVDNLNDIVYNKYDRQTKYVVVASNESFIRLFKLVGVSVKKLDKLNAV